MGEAVERLVNLAAGRIYIPPFKRIRNGKVENVDGYWREAGDFVVPSAIDRLQDYFEPGDPESGQNDREFRISKLAKRYGGRDKFIAAEDRALQSALDRSHITVQVGSAALRKLLDGGELKPGTTSGGADYTPEDRKEVESAFFVPGEKPLYGAMREDPAWAGPLGSLLNYGNYELILKDDMRPYTTFTVGDSEDQAFASSGYGPTRPASQAGFAPTPVVGATHPSDAYPYDTAQGSAQRIKSVDKLPDDLGYVEAQIHAGVGIGNVAGVVEFYSNNEVLHGEEKNWERRGEILRRLQELGIPVFRVQVWVQGEESWSGPTVRTKADPYYGPKIQMSAADSLLAKFARTYVEPHQRMDPEGRLQNISGYWRDDSGLPDVASGPYGTIARSDPAVPIPKTVNLEPFDEDDILAVADYLYGEGDNEALRKGRTTPQTDALDKAMAKSVLAEDGMVYRGMPSYYLDKVTASWDEGFPDPAFVSTSSSSQYAFEWQTGPRNGVVAIRVPKGTHAIDIPKVTGYGQQSELVLDRGLRFRHIGEDPETGVPLLEVVPDAG